MEEQHPNKGKKGKIIPFKPSENSENYSQLLSDLILPFEYEFSDWVSYEDIFVIGKLLWNTAIIRNDYPELSDELLKNLPRIIRIYGAPQTLIHQIIQVKQDKYGTYQDLILDIQTDINDKDELTLSMNLLPNSKLNEAFELKNMHLFFKLFTLQLPDEDEEQMDEMENWINQAERMDEEDPDNEIPGFTDRMSLVVIPKEKFISWAKISKVDQDHMILGPQCFLLIDWVIEDPIADIVEENYKNIFNMMLQRVTTDESLWPEKRSLTMFHDWFDFFKTDIAYDLEDVSINKYGDKYFGE